MSGNSITGELAIIYFSCVFACVYLCGFGCGCHYLHFKHTDHSYILVVKLCNFTVKQKDNFYSLLFSACLEIWMSDILAEINIALNYKPTTSRLQRHVY